jgi:ferredoxin
VLEYFYLIKHWVKINNHAIKRWEEIKMVRKIIRIDEDKCNGCGLCVSACHEGAIGLAGGKAKLLRDDYCDGLGNCLPICPTEAISFEEREAAEYDEAAVKANAEDIQPETLTCGCPGTHSHERRRDAHTQSAPVRAPHVNLSPNRIPSAGAPVNQPPRNGVTLYRALPVETHLGQWPVQIKLVPVNAPYFADAKLLVAADCAAYAYGDFHAAYMKSRITLIGCPKLDEGDYSAKLTAILKKNTIKSVIVARMEVPCCGGIEDAVKKALQNCGKMIPWQVVTISTEGDILED